MSDIYFWSLGWHRHLLWSRLKFSLRSLTAIGISSIFMSWGWASASSCRYSSICSGSSTISAWGSNSSYCCKTVSKAYGYLLSSFSLAIVDSLDKILILASDSPSYNFIESFASYSFVFFFIFLICSTKLYLHMGHSIFF